MRIFQLYLIVINIIGIFIMYSDKRKAERGRWRVPEKTLFIIAFIFGSLGILLGMRLFHHKTKHLKFVYGIPVILIAQIFIIYKLIAIFA